MRHSVSLRALADADASGFEEALGTALAAAVALGREHEVDAESALASWARRYKDRFRRMEQLASQAGVDLAAADGARVRELWDRAGE